MHLKPTKPMLAVAASICMLVAGGGGATAPEQIQAAYISPLVYQPYNCGQLRQEYARIGRRTDEVFAAQAGESSKDAGAVAIGIFLWPALFALAGEDRRYEVARLKGEADALEQAAIQKNCNQLLVQIKDARTLAEKRAAEKATKQSSNNQYYQGPKEWPEECEKRINSVQTYCN